MSRCSLLVLAALLLSPAARPPLAQSTGDNGAPSTAPAAPTPEGVALGYAAAMAASDWSKCAAVMHPDALAQFRRLFMPIVEADASGAVREGLFGGASQAELAKLSDTELFARFFGSMTARMPQLAGAMAGAQITPIGHVDEGPALTHVVFRISTSVEGVSITKVSAMTLKRAGPSWGVMLSGDVEGLAAALGRARGT